MISQLPFAFIALALVSTAHLHSLEGNGNHYQNEESPVDQKEIPWSPDLQVVIEDDNEIKIERRPQSKKGIFDEAEHTNSLMHYFDAAPHNENPELHFESKRYSALNNEKDSNNKTELDFPLNHNHNYVTQRMNRKNSNNKEIPPSSSKIPDYVTEQLMASDVQSHVHVDEEEEAMPKAEMRKTLQVPIGSRVHTVKYQDYSSPGSSPNVVGQYYGKYAHNIIELPSSKPVLPIVFNFRTRSSPIVASQTHFKVADSAPKVQFFQTVEPAHYSRHVVKKPILQNLKEYIVPYQFYVRNIAPVEEYKQTFVPVEKESKSSVHYDNDYPLFTDDYTNRYTSHYANPYGYSPGVGSGGRQSAPSFTYDQEPEASGLSPGYGYSSMVHKNPYMDIAYHLPIRIDDMYKKTFTYEEPSYLSVNKFNKYN